MLQSLALRMGRTVSELSCVLTMDELTDWFARNRKMPVGDERMDYLFAHVCLRIFQAAGIKKPSAGQMKRPAGPADWKLEDFLLFREDDPEPPPVADLSYMRSLFGKNVIKLRKDDPR